MTVIPTAIKHLRIGLKSAVIACSVHCSIASPQAISESNLPHLQKTTANLFNGDFADATYLLSVRQGSTLSSKVSSLRGQGFENAFGEYIGFKKWYSTNWTDLRVLWMTQVDSSKGLVWGISSGEHGDKYKITPAITLGFIYQPPTPKNTTLTFSGMTVIGGILKERTCIADYGDVEGVKEVNCRLAASTLAPSDTLKYLINEKPEADIFISLKYSGKF